MRAGTWPRGHWLESAGSCEPVPGETLVNDPLKGGGPGSAAVRSQPAICLLACPTRALVWPLCAPANPSSGTVLSRRRSPEVAVFYFPPLGQGHEDTGSDRHSVPPPPTQAGSIESAFSKTHIKSAVSRGKDKSNYLSLLLDVYKRLLPNS